MRIIDVTDDEDLIHQIAEVLLDGFATSGMIPWDNLEEAVGEVKDSLAEDRISRAAIDENGKVLGWIGGIHEYALVWELHPLVISAES